MPNDDDPWDETPRCMCCGEQLTYHFDVVEIKMGELTMGKKSGMPYFSPMDSFPDGEEVKYIHLHCLLTRMDFTETKNTSRFSCNLCLKNVSDAREIYRLQMGRIKDTADEGFWEFEPFSEDGSQIFLCTDCVLEGLGEGDHTAGCVMLGMA